MNIVGNLAEGLCFQLETRFPVKCADSNSLPTAVLRKQSKSSRSGPVTGGLEQPSNEKRHSPFPLSTPPSLSQVKGWPRKWVSIVLCGVWVSSVGPHFNIKIVYITFSLSNCLFKLFHSCFCSWRARGNIPFLPAKLALPAHTEPWQPCNHFPHPLPALPSPPPRPPTSHSTVQAPDAGSSP